MVSLKIISDSSNLVYDLNADSKTCQDLATKVAKFIFWKKYWKLTIFEISQQQKYNKDYNRYQSMIENATNHAKEGFQLI